jgi:cytochrome c
MFTCKFLSPFILATAVIFVTEMTLAGPNLGREVKPEEIAAWDISIPPDGSGLPPGSGTATAGGAVYNAKCASCHGVKGIEGPADPLVGGIGTLASKKPVKTVGSYWPYATTLLDYVRRCHGRFRQTNHKEGTYDRAPRHYHQRDKHGA